MNNKEQYINRIAGTLKCVAVLYSNAMLRFVLLSIDDVIADCGQNSAWKDQLKSYNGSTLKSMRLCNSVGTENGNDYFIGNINPIRYRGYYYDVETKLYYLLSRYYDPEVGRFISPDSVEYIEPATLGGLNLYSYCNNDPVMYYDPMGTIPNWLKWVAGGILFVGAVISTALTGGALAPLFLGMCVSILSSGLLEGFISVSNGGDFDEGFWNGAADGALWGGLFAFGSAVMRTIKILTKGVVIGENMGRVGNAARQIGAATYRAPGQSLIKIFGGSNAGDIMLSQNKRWIQRMVNWGVRITDIGIDISRPISRFYSIEVEATKYFWNLIVQLLG